jgi:hydrogenase/urease accessory protein HupE
MMETVDFSATGVDELKNMWAIRQLALGVIFGWATFKKSAPMLTSAYLFLLIVFLGDLTLGIAKQEIPLIITALLMSFIAGGLLVVLKKYK